MKTIPDFQLTLAEAWVRRTSDVVTVCAPSLDFYRLMIPKEFSRVVAYKCPSLEIDHSFIPLADCTVFITHNSSILDAYAKIIRKLMDEEPEIHVKCY